MPKPEKYQFPLYSQLYSIFEELSELENPVPDLDYAQDVLEDGMIALNELRKRITK
jgi:hypothetical protein